jgi:2,3,4,5-tetrahydropyridine-2-carboxylate N-succinyltransferase
MKDIIEGAFEDRANISPQTASSEVKQAVSEAIHLLDSGQARVAEQSTSGFPIQQIW